MSSRTQKKRWYCGDCERQIEYNTHFYDTVKKEAGKEWQAMDGVEKKAWRETLVQRGIYPTIHSDDSTAHLCEMRPSREEVGLLKIEIKKLWREINDLKSKIN